MVFIFYIIEIIVLVNPTRVIYRYKEMVARKRHRASFIRLMTWFNSRIYNETGILTLIRFLNPTW